MALLCTYSNTSHVCTGQPAVTPDGRHWNPDAMDGRPWWREKNRIVGTEYSVPSSVSPINRPRRSRPVVRLLPSLLLSHNTAQRTQHGIPFFRRHKKGNGMTSDTQTQRLAATLDQDHPSRASLPASPIGCEPKPPNPRPRRQFLFRNTGP